MAAGPVAFTGQSQRRDPYAASLWIRNSQGRERKLAQFSFGGGPGIPTGIAGGLVLEYAFDRAAETVVVAAADDLAFFEYDIWAIDVATGEHVRLTRGLRSRYPSVSPQTPAGGVLPRGCRHLDPRPAGAGHHPSLDEGWVAHPRGDPWLIPSY